MDPEANPHRDDDEPMGVGIGGVLQGQRAAWGRAENARRMLLGIDIGGASLAQRQWRAEQAARQNVRQVCHIRHAVRRAPRIHREENADRQQQDNADRQQQEDADRQQQDN